MRAVLQRVNRALVYADGERAAEIGKGLYILLGIAEGDTKEDADLLLEKIPKLRIFTDVNGKMNLSVNDICGDVCVVSNFTLLANYSHGNRPDYLSAAKPNEAKALYEYFVNGLSSRTRKCECGVFGADMTSELSTDGPVTIVMESSALYKSKK